MVQLLYFQLPWSLDFAMLHPPSWFHSRTDQLLKQALRQSRTAGGGHLPSQQYTASPIKIAIALSLLPVVHFCIFFYSSTLSLPHPNLTPSLPPHITPSPLPSSLSQTHLTHLPFPPPQQAISSPLLHTDIHSLCCLFAYDGSQLTADSLPLSKPPHIPPLLSSLSPVLATHLLLPFLPCTCTHTFTHFAAPVCT